MAITDAEFEELAEAPKRTTSDEGTVEERSVDELIAARNHLAAGSAPADPLHGLRISRCKPAGPV